ncbi:MAG: DUF952 domain-containing protein [Pyrinomonadaceae bacterium]
MITNKATVPTWNSGASESRESMHIYHIVLPKIWEEFKDTEFYTAESLKAEGFIHCSFAEQLDTVLERYYRDAGDVVVLTIETDTLTSRLVTEPSTNQEIYPHIYGAINRNAIVGIAEKEV